MHIYIQDDIPSPLSLLLFVFFLRVRVTAIRCEVAVNGLAE